MHFTQSQIQEHFGKESTRLQQIFKNRAMYRECIRKTIDPFNAETWIFRWLSQHNMHLFFLLYSFSVLKVRIKVMIIAICITKSSSVSQSGCSLCRANGSLSSILKHSIYLSSSQFWEETVKANTIFVFPKRNSAWKTIENINQTFRKLRIEVIWMMNPGFW